jgi:hypothetical protein
MTSVAAKLVFSTDYRSKAQVIALAKALGGGSIVIRHEGRTRFNITQHARRDRWELPGVTVVWWPDRFGPLPTAHQATQSKEK